MDTLPAISVSRDVIEWLSRSGSAGTRVIATFRRACHILTPLGELVAMVSPSVGNGPLNIVVDAPFQSIAQGTPVAYQGDVLQVGSLAVVLKNTLIWEPRPDWAGLSNRRSVIVSRLPELWRIALPRAPKTSLLARLDAQRGNYVAPHTGLGHSRFWRGARAVAAGWHGDVEQLQTGAAQLGGLGQGLTPAGDDFLIGLMLWGWLAHEDPRAFCAPLAREALRNTSVASAAWLRAAADGCCSAGWHELLSALAVGAGVAVAVESVLSHGATSGADTLAGFLWITFSRRIA